MLEKIVMGYSGDEAGHDAVKLCGQIVAALGSDVTIVYPYSPLLSSAPAQAAEEGIRKELRALVPDSEVLAQATYHWSSSSWPIHALHSMASYENAQLIVLGAAREGIAGHLHVGLMERMVHGAPCQFRRRPSRATPQMCWSSSRASWICSCSARAPMGRCATRCWAASRRR